MREVEPALSAMYSRVLMRMRAERDQAFGVRMREMFTDMRLLWPALGATIIATHLGLLFWELKYVAISLAQPGLKSARP